MSEVCVQVANSIARESFGVGYVITNLSAALHRAGVNVYIATADVPQDAYESCERVGFPREKVIAAEPLGRERFRFAPSLHVKVRQAIDGSRAVVQAHGMWTYTSYLAGAVSRASGARMVIMPHGELDARALAIATMKKAIAWRAFVRRNLACCSSMWALTDREAQSIRDYGYAGPVAVIPNGMSPAGAVGQDAVAEFRCKHRIGEQQKVLLFLSRIARIKNLPLLLHSFAAALKSHPEWTLVIAGVDERDHLPEVMQLARDLDIWDAVRFIGAAFDEEKAAAFAACSAFVLPSKSEGLPIVALEAMEYAKPLVLTDGWQLPVAAPERFCWRLGSDPASFQAGLLQMMSTPDAALMQMGQAGQKVVRESFSWESVAKRAMRLYASLDQRVS
jgi:poly(glycerol-phosphate) alpha-glucosyltransferase